MTPRFLTTLPVFNEVKHVHSVLDEVLRYSDDILVVDDGSTDGTSEALAERNDILLVQHEQNLGYGAALKSAFDYSAKHDYDVIVTIDCDGQHEPKLIRKFVEACIDADIVSGSRYLKQMSSGKKPPEDRKRINQIVTNELNQRFGLQLTDAFCGQKAYRVNCLKQLNITENGYAMPLELWAQAANAKLNIVELAVPLIYLDEDRSFGGALDDASTRLGYYHLVLDRSEAMVGCQSETKQMFSDCGKPTG